MRVLVALGGNALARRGEPLTADVQRRNVRLAARSVARVAERHDLVITHGNGPQVGLLALQSEAGGDGPMPLDVLGAQTEGMIGYLLERELHNELPERRSATLVTQVVVDAADPAFRHPTKPIGPVYPKRRAEALAAERGWQIAADGEGWRRVVPSPEPRSVVELSAIELLLEAGVIVVCAGGGGIPVCVDAGGLLRGVEAVVDKDRAAALLARELRAEALLLLTDVAAVYADWPGRDAPLRETTPAELAGRRFDPGSMGPKVEAACRFVAATGGRAGIGRLEDAAAVLAGEAGTRVAPDPT